MPKSRAHHPRCPQYDGDDVIVGSRCDQHDWDCRCDLIDRVLEDQVPQIERISDASFSRGTWFGIAQSVTAVIGIANEAEATGSLYDAAALRAAAARLLPGAQPMDPEIAVAIDAAALSQASAMLRHDLEAGYWDNDPASEAEVNAILAGWQAATPCDSQLNVATLPLSLWDEATVLLAVAPQGTSGALDRIEQALAAFTAEPVTVQWRHSRDPECPHVAMAAA